MESKSNHMAEVCKYYGLEWKVKHFAFYREMEASDFIKHSTLQDKMIVAIKEKKWFRVAWMHFKYNLRVTVAEHVVRKVK